MNRVLYHAFLATMNRIPLILGAKTNLSSVLLWMQ